MSPKPSTRGVLIGLAAAVSFGVSAPLAKRLLADVEPQMLAGLLYLGAFCGLAALSGTRAQTEAPLRRSDLPRLAAVVASGGVIAPVLLLLGLDRLSGVSGSLLLNLEGPLTILVGVSLFHEHLSRRAAVGATVIFTGAIVLTVESTGGTTDWLGLLFVAAACGAWSIDNNVTQSLTVRDPRTIVAIKAGCAGLINVAIAAMIGQRLPGLSILAACLALGAFSYGLSTYWDALALRALGAAREAAIFAVAPFVGALVAPLILPDSISLRDFAAGALMAAGVGLLLTEHHRHLHRHVELQHEHAHEHDEHHQHAHAILVASGTRHSHGHVHDEIAHVHEHVSDVHHRHPHRH